MSIETTLRSMSSQEAGATPVFFDLSKLADVERLEACIQENEIRHVIDDYEEQLKELFQINNPTLVYTSSFENEFAIWRDKAIAEAGGREKHGLWVFFSWSDTLVHILKEDDFQRVRSARNRNLITEDEQKKFSDSTVGIGGLSVGNSVALALVLQGGANRLKLADFDRLGLSNLNRIRGSIENLGLHKVVMTARQIYALNPYAQIELFPEGITEENISHFFDGLDVVVDELDTIPIKLRIREEARKRKIPVVMGADNGDNAIIDIERHDIDATGKFFHGSLGDVTLQELQGLDKFGIGRTITKMLGPENITARMQDSLLEMGKTIVSWPQLGGAALLNGIGVAYCVRKILTGEPLEQTRALLSLDEKLVPDYNDAKQIEQRHTASDKFAKIFGL